MSIHAPRTQHEQRMHRDLEDQLISITLTHRQQYLDSLMTAADAARICNVSRSTIYRWRRTGQLSAITIAGRYFFERKALSVKRSRAGAAVVL